MRKTFDLLLLLFLLFFLFWQKDQIIANYNHLLASPCDQAITFRAGEVDQGYGITREQFLTKIEEAGQIWSKVVEKNLFEHDSQGKMTINLIYSERQSMADKLDSLEANLRAGRQSLNSLNAEYKNLQADFEKKLQAFNAEVSNWNKLGGAPEETFNRLKSQEAELKAEADKLNQMARQLNLSAQKYNLGVGQFNQSAETFNQAITAIPEVGFYYGSSSQIDIYLTSSEKELIHTLAHEMGHALGLSHTDEPQSIMYPYTSEVIQPDSQETSRLQDYCRKRNLDLVRERIGTILDEQFKRIKT